MLRIISLLLVLTFANIAWADSNLLSNGDFEQGLAGWNAFWSRSGGGTAQLAADSTHQGNQALQIQYEGQEDWCVNRSKPLPVQPGDIYELTGSVRVQGEATASLSVILYDANHQPLAWDFGGRPIRQAEPFQSIRNRFVIPPSGATIVPRLMGMGAGEVWLDDVALVKSGSVTQLQTRELPAELSIESATLRVTFFPLTAALNVLDKRTGGQHVQQPETTLVVLNASKQDDHITFQLLKPDDVLTVTGTIRLEPDQPEFVVELTADGAMRQPLSFPLPFVTNPGQFLIMPVNEGISYPVDDDSLPPMNYYLFGGHGLCMAFWGSTDLQSSLMAIVETPDDALVDVPRRDNRLCLAPQWVAQHGQFGPTRRIRYVSLDQGGYVAMCKRYRQYARQIGRFRTLAEKRAVNPHVDRLVGAVNVWCWDRSGADMCQEMQQLGIQRILWSHRDQPESIARMNEMGVLTSRYDIYQDVMDPANFPQIGYQHPDWTTRAWPHDIVTREDGSWSTGWRVKGKGGEWYDWAVLCDRLAVDYARQRIPLELATHPYRCRFIDTTTAAPWRECYHSDHRMTRSESRQFRTDLLAYVSDTCGLVTGSETGHDAAAAQVHYFEGMLSLGPYRIPDSGRDMQRLISDVPQSVAKFQTGHYYRLPLWELVYHDCVVSQWYWGDYNNKLPGLWDRRDLWNALYGTPPMFMFNRDVWQQYSDRFLQSYQTATPVARATAYSEMTAHRWLTDDHSVQQTEFANGVVVTVNFGDQPHVLLDGQILAPSSQRIKNLAP